MLGPAERITNRCALIWTGCSDERVRDLVKKRRRNAANFLYHLRRVTSEVAAQCLQNAPRMLQGQIAFRKTEGGMALVDPGPPVVAALRPAPTRENAGRAFFRVAKIFTQNAGRIREVDDVIAEEEIVLDNVPDEAPEKCDVAARAHRHPDIGQRAGARKSWIDMNDGRAALLCFHHPAETDRVGFRHGRAFD